MTERTPTDVLLHPVVLTALSLWFLNDHFFKDAWPGAVTGKLSDVTGLLVCPLLALGVYERCHTAATVRARRCVLVSSVLALALFMLRIKTSGWGAFAYCWGLAALQWPLRAALTLFHQPTLPPLRPLMLTMDPTDLWTLPTLFVPLWLERERLFSARPFGDRHRASEGQPRGRVLPIGCINLGRRDAPLAAGDGAAVRTTVTHGTVSSAPRGNWRRLEASVGVGERRIQFGTVKTE